MSFKIENSKVPDLEIPQMLCDGKLSSKLDEFPYFSNNFNHHFTASVIGKQGSGKSSLILSWLSSKNSPMKKVFHHIYVFMPKQSQKSIAKNPYNTLPDDQLFESLNLQDLADVYTRIQANAEENELSLIIFDDVQDGFRHSDAESLLTTMVANQRHNRLSLIFLAQNFLKLPTRIRDLTHIYVLFDAGKRINERVFKELIQTIKTSEMFNDLMEFVYRKPHDFLTVNTRDHSLWKKYEKIIFE